MDYCLIFEEWGAFWSSNAARITSSANRQPCDQSCGPAVTFRGISLCIDRSWNSEILAGDGGIFGSCLARVNGIGAPSESHFLEERGPVRMPRSLGVPLGCSSLRGTVLMGACLHQKPGESPYGKGNVNMRSIGKKYRGVVTAIGAAGLVLGLSLGALRIVSATSQWESGVVPVDAKILGRTYDEWAAAWWEWVLEVPFERNPLLDGDGTCAAEGQYGQIWFLAGSWIGPVERTVTVPTDKYLFFPLINNVYLNFPEDPPMDDATIAYVRGLLRDYFDGASLECTIDGVPVVSLQDYSTSSALFNLRYVKGGIIETFYGIDQGVGYPCFDEGYYLMLAPLSAGTHEIHFSATAPDSSTLQDVTYHLTIEE